MAGRCALVAGFLVCLLAASAVAQLPADAGASSPRTAVVDAPAREAAEYRLGPGDVVKVTVYNNPDLTTEAEISQTGRISFPLIGEAAIGGLTRREAEQEIAGRLGSGGFVPDAHVNVLISNYRSQQVAVIGEVHKPGKYPISQAASVTDILAAAGGITPAGSSTITLIRKDGQGQTARYQMNVKDVLSGDASKNVLLGSGDIVYVPPVSMFYIYGEVRRPGSYPLAPEMTVRQALSVGGGLTVRGTERGIRVERRGPDGKSQTYRARLTDRLQENDVVHVPESWF
ncbi:MAG: polysaccharide export protein EpsE [Burkholderiales bacterium]|nr:polysaccharide export protein EpsE [Burkholderiales bacterium]